MKILKFYTDRCPACKMIEPFLVEVETENKGVEVLRVNAHDNPEIALEYGVMSAPVLVFIKDGKEISRLKGYASKELILQHALV